RSGTFASRTPCIAKNSPSRLLRAVSRASKRRRPPPLPASGNHRPDLAARPARPASRRGLYLRHAPQSVLRPLRRVRPTPRVYAGRRHPPPGLEGLVQDRPLLRQTIRGRNQPPQYPRRGRQRVDALRSGPTQQIQLRLHYRRLSRLLAAAATGLGGPAHL